MPQNYNAERGKPITVYLPERTYNEVKILLADPLAGGRVRYGAMSSLVTELITRWLNERRATHTFPENPNVSRDQS